MMDLKCGIWWFVSFPGICATGVSLVTAFLGAWLNNKWDREEEERKYGN